MNVAGFGKIGIGACLAGADNRDRRAVPVEELGHIDSALEAACTVDRTEVQLIAVCIPPDGYSSADLRHVFHVARTIGEYIAGRTIVVIKSMVLDHTCGEVEATFGQPVQQRGERHEYRLVANAEFLSEGAAVEAFGY